VIVDATSGSEDGKIVFNTVVATTETDVVEVLGSATAGIVRSSGNQDLVLQTGNTTTGSITIADGANTNITLAPNGTGDVVIQGTGASSELNIISGGSNIIAYSTDNSNSQIVATAEDNSYVDLYAFAGNTYVVLSDTGTGATGPYLEFYHNSASPAVNDDVGILQFSGRDSAANKQVYGSILVRVDDPTSTTEDAKFVFSNVLAGAQTAYLDVSPAGLRPRTNDQMALGSATLSYSDLFLAEGGVINWDNGDATLTQVGNDVTLAGASLTARVKPRTGTTTSSATPTINTDNVDEYYITAQTVDITSFTTNLSGTPTLGQTLFISVIGTAARAITWGASFGNGPVALPTTTVTTTELSVLFKYDGSIWRCYASGSRV
jgi:hypothetical protein